MSRHHEPFVRKGLIGTCAFVALVLLAAFYSTVSGAVDRATRQRLASSEGGPTSTVIASPRPAPRAGALVAGLER
jgi:hypothetical protein